MTNRLNYSWFHCLDSKSEPGTVAASQNTGVTWLLHLIFIPCASVMELFFFLNYQEILFLKLLFHNIDQYHIMRTWFFRIVQNSLESFMESIYNQNDELYSYQILRAYLWLEKSSSKLKNKFQKYDFRSCSWNKNQIKTFLINQINLRLINSSQIKQKNQIKKFQFSWNACRLLWFSREQGAN